ncbi:beta-mannosidase [Niastella vici]|uniref:Mannan endo-1,4-beta-mannosidase n=1 Tax=Niastella vici TaxID=1703345 RepID=A0A1V9FY27_9BACT|nr:glycosyl hydrolase [Niastella vici]OQP63255.1 beta-mannosidase [Niastella vici]
MNIKTRYASLLLAALLGANCSPAQPAANQVPADKLATAETVHLCNNLKKLAGKGYMFGHQDDLAYGVNWRYENGRSDVKEVAGNYPAVYGWELGGLEANEDKNIDGVPFKKMRQFIREGYERGGVITISWHARSPFGAAKGAWDTTHGSVASILPGGENHLMYKAWLDELAKFFLSLKNSQGEAIPVLFRPFHELTGNWFWWGRNACSAEQFKVLWRFTQYYLQNEKKVHNLLYVYNTASDFKTKGEFLERYPGDDMVDMISFDSYQYDDPVKSDWFVKNTSMQLDMLTAIATDKNKLMAIAETGYEQIPFASWWTETLAKAIGQHKISYVLVWRNHGYNQWMKRMHYYAPYKGHGSEADFVKFYQLDNTLFEKDVANEKLYE